MADPKQLPYLLALMDDDSDVVRRSVAEALREFGSDLKPALASLDEPPDDAQMAKIQRLLKAEPEKPKGPRFEPGQLVKHRRYGYRGVVVAVDETCQATEAWYQSNATQPDRNQPWYHVLVHNADQTTYAAQSSLDVDDEGGEVNHPWIDDFFSDFIDGGYVRNQRPWMT